MFKECWSSIEDKFQQAIDAKCVDDVHYWWPLAAVRYLLLLTDPTSWAKAKVITRRRCGPPKFQQQKMISPIKSPTSGPTFKEDRAFGKLSHQVAQLIRIVKNWRLAAPTNTSDTWAFANTSKFSNLTEALTLSKRISQNTVEMLKDTDSEILQTMLSQGDMVTEDVLLSLKTLIHTTRLKVAREHQQKRADNSEINIFLDWANDYGKRTYVACRPPFLPLITTTTDPEI